MSQFYSQRAYTGDLWSLCECLLIHGGLLHGKWILFTEAIHRRPMVIMWISSRTWGTPSWWVNFVHRGHTQETYGHYTNLFSAMGDSFLVSKFCSQKAYTGDLWSLCEFLLIHGGLLPDKWILFTEGIHRRPMVIMWISSHTWGTPSWWVNFVHRGHTQETYGHYTNLFSSMGDSFLISEFCSQRAYRGDLWSLCEFLLIHGGLLPGK